MQKTYPSRGAWHAAHKRRSRSCRVRRNALEVAKARGLPPFVLVARGRGQAATMRARNFPTRPQRCFDMELHIVPANCGRSIDRLHHARHRQRRHSIRRQTSF
jgi:hypothetical protein